MTWEDLPPRLIDALRGEMTINDDGSTEFASIITQHPDGSISVDGDVNWEDQSLSKLPIRFRKVTGDFLCFSNQLTSLDGAPQTVGGSFYCYGNRLTSLDGLGEVKGAIYCLGNSVPHKKLLADYHKKRARLELTSESSIVDRLTDF